MVRAGSVLVICLAFFGTFVSAATDMTEEEILKWEAPEEFKQQFPYYLSGVDEEGSEIWITEQGKWDARKIVEAGGQELQDFRKYVQQMYTRVGYKNRKSDKNQQAVVIIDMDGLTPEKAFHIKLNIESLQMLKTFVDYARGGGFKKGYIVNGNAVFEMISVLGKPLFGELSGLIEVFGTNKEKWIPQLLKQIPKSQLPPSLGGDKEHKFLAVYG